MSLGGTPAYRRERCASTVTDITDRVLAETALRVSLHELAEAQRIGGLGSWSLDPATGVPTASPETYAILGLDPEAVRRSLAGLLSNFTPASVTRMTEAIEATLRTGEPWQLDLEFLRPDGTPGWVAGRGEVQHDASGQVVRLHGTMLDIGERVEAQAALAKAHADLARSMSLLTSILDGADDHIYAKDLDGRYLLVNRADAAWFGRPREEIIGRTDADLVGPQEGATYRQVDRAVVESGKPLTYEQEAIRAGVTTTWLTTKNVIRDASGHITGLFAITREITEQRRQEAQLRQTAKMEAVGQLAGGVAHDFNNMLTAIRGYAELVVNHLPPADEQDRADLAQVIRAADRAAELTRQLLAFSRKQVLVPRVLDPGAIVAGIAPMLRRLLGEHIELGVHSREDTGRVLLDPTQLEQVIVNLAVNARDAMPTGGQLTIETANIELDAAYTAAHPGAAAGPHVMLAVSDTGIGMDAPTRDHIFEPFFTTKGPGQGTGMGLATVYGIVKQSGGSIFVYSEPGHGTSFRLYFPRVFGESGHSLPEADAHEHISTGHETVLLVEDEVAVRDVVRRTLVDLGYAVLEAGDGTDALAVAATHSGPIDLLVTDVIMPGMHGVDLAERLTAARPGLRTLYVSGFTENSVIHHGVVADEVGYLPKPFSGEALAQAIRAVLDGAPRG